MKTKKKGQIKYLTQPTPVGCDLQQTERRWVPHILEYWHMELWCRGYVMQGFNQNIGPEGREGDDGLSSLCACTHR